MDVDEPTKMRRCQLPAISNPHTHVPIADNEETCFCLFSQLHQQEEKKRRAVDAFLCCATEKTFQNWNCDGAHNDKEHLGPNDKENFQLRMNKCP